MKQPFLECVPNISEGRDLARVAVVASSISSVHGALLLDQTSDADHNRSVFTFAGPRDAVAEAAVRAVAAAAEVIDLTEQRGVHPRIGALDVLPFVPLPGGVPMAGCIEIAHAVGARIWHELGIPVYFYAEAALRPDRRKLEDVRRGQFEGLREAVLFDEDRQPDLGGPSLHLTAGAVIVGARRFLIAFNINLQSEDLGLAKSIAVALRERDGGLPGVKALGLPLHTRGVVQVSINITDYEAAPLHVVYTEVERLAAKHGVGIAESELIGLMPRAALLAAGTGFLKLPASTITQLVETRMEASLRTDEREA